MLVLFGGVCIGLLVCGLVVLFRLCVLVGRVLLEKDIRMCIYAMFRVHFFRFVLS